MHDTISLWMSRPQQKPWPLMTLLDDMRATTHRLAVVTYALTDPSLAVGIIESPATGKLVIIHPDVLSLAADAVQMLTDYFRYAQGLALGSGLHHARCPNGGVMHAKMALTDTVLWC